MALDNFNRVAALNAVIEAWTRKGSNPFIKDFNLTAGSSYPLQCTKPWCGIVMAFSTADALTGLWMVRFSSAGNSGIKVVSSATNISLTAVNTGVLTIENNRTSGTAVIKVVSLEGICE